MAVITHIKSTCCNCWNKMSVKTHSNDCYGYMRPTHILAVFTGSLFTRTKLKPTDKPNEDVDVEGYRYSFDKRMIPLWIVYAILNTYLTYNNYTVAVEYVGYSFKKCFTESYCLDVIELANRNIGPTVHILSSVFYGGRYRAHALAGTERILRFLKETNGGVKYSKRHLPLFTKFYSLALLCLYSSCLWLYSVTVPCGLMIMYIVNSMGMTTVLSLTQFQYAVFRMGYERINDLIENISVNDNRKLTKLLLVRLTERYAELSQLVEDVNQSYVPDHLLQWPYNITRLIMVVIRITEYVVAYDGPNGTVLKVLTIEHSFEIFLFVLQNTSYCVVGTKLSTEAKRTLESLQKLKLQHVYKMDLDVQKAVKIFGIRVSTYNVRASVGGYIVMDMGFINTLFSAVITYALVLFQFKRQKGMSKSMHEQDK